MCRLWIPPLNKYRAGSATFTVWLKAFILYFILAKVCSLTLHRSRRESLRLWRRSEDRHFHCAFLDLQQLEVAGSCRRWRTLDRSRGFLFFLKAQTHSGYRDSHFGVKKTQNISLLSLMGIPWRGQVVARFLQPVGTSEPHILSSTGHELAKWRWWDVVYGTRDISYTFLVASSNLVLH